MKFDSRFSETNAMDIIARTVTGHEEICNSLGIFKEYASAVTKGKNIGGNAADESKMHLLGRYLNSAARVQLAVCNEDEELQPINDQLISQLLSGDVYIIDIAAGNGAGVISMLNSIWYKRTISHELTTDRLDIKINAIDYSAHSLNYYAMQLDILKDDYKNAGMKVEFTKWEIDLRQCQDLTNVISNIKSKCVELSNGPEPRFLLACSAISGVHQSFFERELSASYALIAQSFKEKNSVFFWVEPFTRNNWLLKTWEKLKNKLFPENASKGSSEPVVSHEAFVNFYWLDPHTSAIINTGAEFYLMGLANE